MLLAPVRSQHKVMYLAPTVHGIRVPCTNQITELGYACTNKSVRVSSLISNVLKLVKVAT